MTHPTPADPAATGTGGDVPFRSPLFRQLALQFDSARRRVILETGPASTGTLALLEGTRCRLLVADAALALDALGREPLDPDQLRRRVEVLIPDAGPDPVDVVLCWDLLNYLDPPLLAAFGARLARIMAPQGRVHAYLHTAHATMPRRPQRYAAWGGGRVVRLDQDAAERKAPRYSAWGLEKHGLGLRVERSILLQSGMQEYLLRFDPAAPGTPRR